MLAHAANAQLIPDFPPGGISSGVCGDPHIFTFDRLRFDCQARGEFTTVTSLQTPGFKVQERFHPVTPANFHASVSTGVVFQDVGMPKVEFSTPRGNINQGQGNGNNSPALNQVGNCGIDLYVDGIAKLFTDDLGAGIDFFQDAANSRYRIKHTATELSLDITVEESTKFGCNFLVQVFLPSGYRSGETILGLLGTPNGNPNDDWRTPNGATVTVPANQNARMFRDAYEYCVDNWMVQNAADSLFTYVRDDESFANFYGGDDAYQAEIETALDSPSAELQGICGDDKFCILDGTLGIRLEIITMNTSYDILEEGRWVQYLNP